jgi:DNA polymerase-3 subunit gamma/tau
MSYLVLARKYRPRSFEQLVGQPHVVQALVNALRSQRLHHAYLFTGTRGVGKTTVSRILAKSLNCVGPDGTGGITAQPCGVCNACRDIDAGRHVDYVELDAASNRGVEEISQLLDQAVYKPVVGRFKVYMIDEVHMLSNHAFNAMLKTLEEPPEYLKFVLATTDPQKLPPTVLSRCLQFNLRPMAPQTVHEYLQQVLAQEGIEAEPAALRLLARAAQGSMRDGLSLTDQAIAYGAGRLEEAAVRQMLGSVDRGHAVRSVEAIAAGDAAALIGAVDALRALGLSALGLLDEIAAMLQQMAVLQALPDAADEADPDTPALARVATHFEADEIQLFYSIVLHGRGELALAPDEYSGLVMVLLRMLAFRPQTAGERRAPPNIGAAKASGAARSPAVVAEASGPVSRPADALASQRTAAGPTPLSAPCADAPAADAESSCAIGAADRWAQTVAQLIERGAVTALARELALQAQCLSIDDDAAASVWRLRVERESLRAPAQVQKLQLALAALLDRPARIEIEAGVADDSPALRDAAERARRQREAERIIHDDPFVQSMLQQFKTARIVPGSVKPTVQ